MDWDRAIERNREALKRIVASLFAMAAIAGEAAFTSPLWGGRRSSDRRVGVEVELQPPPDASRRPPHKGEVKTEPPVTLPRHLHRAVLRLLRPAEAAARRLVIVAARDLVLPPPAPPRPRKPKPKPKSAFLRGRVGTGIILPRNVAHPQSRACRGIEGQPRKTLCLPLTDTLPRWRGRRPAARSVPRISSFSSFSAPSAVPVRRQLSPSDPIDATRLALRLAALARALDDLPREARRFACWRSRRARIGSSPVYGGEGPPKAVEGVFFRRISPLRPGRPPGQRSAKSRRPAQEIDDVLADLQWFAFKALEQPDTS